MKIFLFFAAASSLLAQSDSRVQRLVDQSMRDRTPLKGVRSDAFRLGHPVENQQPSRTLQTLSGVLPRQAAKPGSVPLIEMQIPKDVHFTMQQAQPPNEPIDNMLVNVPAPPCRPVERR